MKDFYCFEPNTGEFLSVEPCLESPREKGVYLSPPNSVDKPPLTEKQGFARVWNGTKWIYKLDKRGTRVWDEAGNPHIWQSLGDIPEGYSLEQPLPLKKAEAKRAVIAFADSLTAKINAQYSEAERASWPSKEREVALIKSGAQESETPWITALATETKLSRAALAGIIEQKAKAYRTISITVELLRGQTSAAIDAATTNEAVEAVLEQSKAAALAKAAELGLV